MEQNVGGSDRIARFLVGAVLLAVGLATLSGLVTLAAGSSGQLVGGVATFVGLVVVTTAARQKCLLYSVIGVDTCKR